MIKSQQKLKFGHQISVSSGSQDMSFRIILTSVSPATRGAEKKQVESNYKFFYFYMYMSMCHSVLTILTFVLLP